MSDASYEPIACGLHENYQYAVMRRARLDLGWQREDGSIQEQRLLPLDVFTREGAEYLLVENPDGGSWEIRLDRIIQARWTEDGSSLDPEDG